VQTPAAQPQVSTLDRVDRSQQDSGAWDVGGIQIIRPPVESADRWVPDRWAPERATDVPADEEAPEESDASAPILTVSPADELAPQLADQMLLSAVYLEAMPAAEAPLQDALPPDALPAADTPRSNMADNHGQGQGGNGGGSAALIPPPDGEGQEPDGGGGGKAPNNNPAPDMPPNPTPAPPTTTQQATAPIVEYLTNPPFTVPTPQAPNPTAQTKATTQAPPPANMPGTPTLSFAPSADASNPSVQFTSQASGYSLALTSNGVTYNLGSSQVQMNVVNGNSAPQVVAQDATGTSSLGYGLVDYNNVYTGVTLQFFGNAQNQLEYDFSVAPGAAPQQIQLSFQGAQQLSLDGQGDLVVQTALQTLVQHAPLAYQYVNGVRQLVSSNFIIDGTNQVGFTVGKYDPTQALVIDPGSSGPDTVTGTVFDDLNGDGQQQSGEPGLGVWTVQLYDSGNNLVGTTQTASDGSYSFTGLTAGTYTVQQVVQTGWTQTAGPSGPVTVTDSGPTTANFGDFQYGTIAGFKYNDLNGDGVWESNEPPLANVEIDLYTESGGVLSATPVQTTQTNSAGYFSFSGLGPQASGTEYAVVENLPGWTQTDPATSTPNTLLLGNGQLAYLVPATSGVSVALPAGGAALLTGTGSVTVNYSPINLATITFLNDQGQMETDETYLTQFDVTVTDATGQQEELNTFCVDLNHNVTGAGQTYPVFISNSESLNDNFAAASEMAYIYQTFGQQALGNDAAAATQLALWTEMQNPSGAPLTENGDGSYSSGTFTVNFDGNPDAANIVNEANQELAASAGATTAGAWLDASAAGDATNRGQSLMLPVAALNFGDTSLTATGVPVTSVEGQPFTSVIATVKDVDGTTTANDLSAQITWGDGTTSTVGAAAFTPTGAGTWNLTASHTYFEEGAYPIQIVVSDDDGSQATATTTAQVAEAPLEAVTPPMFQPPAQYNAGNTPDSLASLTLDNGTKLLLVANFYGNNVTVLEDNGDGTFTHLTDLATGAGPNGFAVGDFGNGHQDFAIANYNSNTISVFLGDGTGNFTLSQTLSTGANPANEMAIGDFDATGKLDLATANQGDGTVSIFMGNGDGTFANAVSVNGGPGNDAVVAGDFTCDGLLDLAVANSANGTVTMLLNQNGTLVAQTPIAVGANPFYIVAGDFNKDGALDLATADSGSGTVSVLLNNGNGTFANAVAYNVGSVPDSLAVGDLNGDNNPDIVVGNYGSSNVALMLGNGAGGFSVTSLDTGAGTGPNGVVIDDFNGDGSPDIATANQNTDNVSILLNNTAIAVPTRWSRASSTPAAPSPTNTIRNRRPSAATTAPPSTGATARRTTRTPPSPTTRPPAISRSPAARRTPTPRKAPTPSTSPSTTRRRRPSTSAPPCTSPMRP